MATITFTVQDAKLAELKAGILKVMPVPVVDGVPTMGENAWLKQIGVDFYMNLYRAGKQRLAKEAAAIDSNLVT